MNDFFTFVLGGVCALLLVTGYALWRTVSMTRLLDMRLTELEDTVAFGYGDDGGGGDDEDEPLDTPPPSSPRCATRRGGRSESRCD